MKNLTLAALLLSICAPVMAQAPAATADKKPAVVTEKTDAKTAKKAAKKAKKMAKKAAKADVAPAAAPTK